MFPARAGMNRFPMGCLPETKHVPRPCGDEPADRIAFDSFD